MFRPIAVEDYLRSARLVLGRGGDARTLAEPGELDPTALAGMGRAHRGEPLSLQFVSVALDRGAYRAWVRSGQRPAFQRSSAAARVGLIARVLAALARLSLVIRGRVPGGQAAAAQVQVGEHRAGCNYYARVTRDAGYVAIQYWFLYPMNDWRSSFGGVNDHEGDWGQITVFLADTDDGPVPAWVAFSSDDEVGADLRRRWDDPDRPRRVTTRWSTSERAATRGPTCGEYLGQHRPEPARGGGAPSPQPGPDPAVADPEGQIGIPFIDYRRGDGLEIGPGGDHVWQASLIDESTDWVVDYGGLWGLDTTTRSAASGPPRALGTSATGACAPPGRSPSPGRTWTGSRPGPACARTCGRSGTWQSGNSSTSSNRAGGGAPQLRSATWPRAARTR